MNVIFTDVDGVLNNHKTTEHISGYRGIELKKVKILKELCDKTDSKLVLSSSWRAHVRLKDTFGKYLLRKFKAVGLEIYDRTPEIQWDRRECEISEWLRGKKVEHIIILDDEDYYWRGNLNKFFIDTAAFGTIGNPFDGLTEEHITYILEHFDDYVM